MYRLNQKVQTNLKRKLLHILSLFLVFNMWLCIDPPHGQVVYADPIVTVEVTVKPLVKPIEPIKIVELPEVELWHPPRPNVPDAAGNAYPAYPYQCTRYVKDKRPDIPNHLGNANLWFNELKDMGYMTSDTPIAGAIGQSRIGMHVIYVERVNADGSIHLSERNYDYNGSYRERNAPASDFLYIY